MPPGVSWGKEFSWLDVKRNKKLVSVSHQRRPLPQGSGRWDGGRVPLGCPGFQRSQRSRIYAHVKIVATEGYLPLQAGQKPATAFPQWATLF